MEIVIPFKPRDPKSRLANILSEDERRSLAFSMLFDVIDACGEDNVTILSNAECDEISEFKVFIDSRSLDEAVTSFIKKFDVAIIMSDLPLINRKIVSEFLEIESEICIAPGRKAGTNMLLSRSRDFYTSYHYGSFLKHISICEKLGLSYSIFDSFFASVDVDEESDVLELMIHGKGKRSYEFLESIGFYVDFSEKEPRLLRR